MSKMGNTKHSTDDLIDDAVAQQKKWLEQRRSFARAFFTKLNVFAKPSQNKVIGKPAVKSNNDNKKSVGCYCGPLETKYGPFYFYESKVDGDNNN